MTKNQNIKIAMMNDFETRLSQVAIKKGFLSSGTHALEEFTDYSSAGENKTFYRYLIDKGCFSDDQGQELMQEIRKITEKDYEKTVQMKDFEVNFGDLVVEEGLLRNDAHVREEYEEYQAGECRSFCLHLVDKGYFSEEKRQELLKELRDLQLADEENPEEDEIEETAGEETPEEGGEIKRYNSTIQESAKIYRTKNSGSYRICSSEAWGHYLMKVEDPQAKMIEAISEHGLHELEEEELEKLLEEARQGGMELSEFERNGIKLNKNFSKIPAELWSRWIALCFYMCPQTGSRMSSSMHGTQLEVQVCLLRNKITTESGLVRAGSEWKMVIPKQVVSGVSVKAELNKNIDIETGEEYTQFPPEGWLHAGSSHSHNTMGAFFSGTDNNSEVACPGFHVVIGNIDHKNKQYTYASSICLRKMRKEAELEEIVDTAPLESEFHKDVLGYIDTVVSANKKIYEAKQKEDEEKPTGSALRFSQWSNDNEEGASTMLPWELQGPPRDLAEAQAREHFLSSLAERDGAAAELLADLDVDDITDLDDLELYFNDEDIDPNFPYHSEISSIVDNALSQGYNMADVLLSLRKAKEEYDAFTQEVLNRDW